MFIKLRVNLTFEVIILIS